MSPEKMLQLFSYFLESEKDHAGQPDSAFELLVELWSSIVRERCSDTEIATEIDGIISDIKTPYVV